MKSKLAVLIPTYNGGSLLEESIRSCAQSGLSGNRYEIIVVDNCSTDGSADNLPPFDDSGARIQIFRNEENLGRIGNWNRAVWWAEQLSFTYYTFLFVGDVWQEGGSLPELVDRLDYTGANFAMANLLMSDVNDSNLRQVRRFHLPGETAIIDTAALLSFVINLGVFPFGPLQSNIYRNLPGHNPRFRADFPLLTDQEATALYLSSAGGSSIATDKSFVCWRAHPSRTHCRSKLDDFLRESPEAFNRVQSATGISVHWPKIKATQLCHAFLEIVRRAPPDEWPRLIRLALHLHVLGERRPGALHVSFVIYRYLIRRQPTMALPV